MVKFLRIAAIATPLVLTAGTVGIYLAVASKKTTPKAVETKEMASHSHQGAKHQTPSPTKVVEHKNIYDQFEIFPTLDQHDFYGDIRIVEVGKDLKDKIGITGMKVIIDDEMKAKIINYVLRHMKTSEGEISYGYDEVDSPKVNFYFKWMDPDSHYHYKTYTFSLTDHNEK